MIDERQKCHIAKDSSSVTPAGVPKSIIQHDSFNENVTDHEFIAQTGSKVKIRWTPEKVKDSGWRAEWYEAMVHKYCQESDTITVSYSTEPGVPYDEKLTPLIANNKIKLVWSPI